jgi:hypothetical protein
LSVSRRDFMKVVGVSVASLALTSCRIPLPVTCYIPMLSTPTPAGLLLPRERLRRSWLSFGELAQVTQQDSGEGNAENEFGKELMVEHRKALDELVASGELSSTVADLVQEAYDAAVYHVWRSYAPITCYEPVIVDFAPVSAGILVQQSEILGKIADENTIDPNTLAKARAALEKDMAFYAMTDAEVASLYDRIISEWQAQGQAYPTFENQELNVTPEAKSAAQFIISLLTSK